MGIKVCSIHEEDAPGISLAGRDPKMLKVVELQQWLQSKGASTKSKKANLVLR